MDHNEYWRDNGSIFVIIKSLQDIFDLLNKILNETKRIEPKLEEYFQKFRDDTSEQSLIKFARIMARTSDYQWKIGASSETAIVMSCIHLESRINMFCYFNLGEETTDAIETLSLVKKMEVIHKILGIKPFKGTKPYEALRDLVEWRNLYVHGKCTDIPKKNIKANHFSSPEKYRDTKDYIELTIKYLSYFIIMVKHLNKCSKHEYTSSELSQHVDIEMLIEKLRKFKFE